MLYDYLIEAFGYNEPIFINDIQYEDYSDIWLKKELSKLCENRQLIRYERGIYYIPQKTLFGESFLNPNKVIDRKYLSDNGNRIGFFTGIAARDHRSEQSSYKIKNPDRKLRQALFLIDSNDYTHGKINEYDYIHDYQIEWYGKNIRKMQEIQPDVKSMTFPHFHY